MKWQYIYLAIFFIPLIILLKPQILDITGLDVFSTEDTGEGEFSIGGGQSGGIKGIPPSAGAPSAPSAGGEVSGGGYLILEDVLVIPAKFNLRGFVGINFSAKIYLKNQGNNTKNIAIESSNLGGILEFSETNFSIEPQEEKIIGFAIITPNIPDIYNGSIILTSGNKKAEIPFTIRVVSEISLFDILLDTPKRIKIGQNLEAKVTLTQAGFDEKEDVALVYEIKNRDGAIVLNEIETIAVQGTKTFEKQFNTQTLGFGNYVLTAEVIYSGGSAVASSGFEVSESGEILPGFGLIIYLAMIFMLLISIIVVSTVLYKISKEEKMSEYKSLLSRIQ